MASPQFEQALAAGRARFVQGHYFAAHEGWETGWRETHGDERDVLQALVLWAAALHHHQQGRQQGAHRLLLRALERVGALGEGFDGLDVEQLREALVTSLEASQHPFGEAAAPAWPGAVAEAEGDLVELEHQTACPYCGELVLVAVAPEDAAGATYVEDCPVCCRPWQVVVQAGRVSIDRDDAQG
jgi:uncharacterized protein